MGDEDFEKGFYKTWGDLSGPEDHVNHHAVARLLEAAGYTEKDIDYGCDWAAAEGYDSADQLGQLALSRILLSDDQLDAGGRVGWEPVDWGPWTEPKGATMTMIRKYLNETWTVDDMRDYGMKDIAVKAEDPEIGGYVVARIGDPGIEVDNLDLLANAELIAAAPELLRQLDSLMNGVAAAQKRYRPLDGDYAETEALIARLKEIPMQVEETPDGP